MTSLRHLFPVPLGSAKADHVEAERRSSQDSRVSDEMNTESQKQKVR